LPVLAALGAEERALFLEEYARRLRSAYPELPGGRTLFPFRRSFVVAQL
jgi:trans-aconitate 2-methyltransferase